MRLSRRDFVSFLGALPFFASGLVRAAADTQSRVDDRLVVVDGWVLRHADLVHFARR